MIAEREFDVLTSGFTSYDPYGVAYFKQVYASDSELNKSGTGTPEMDDKIAELQQLPTQEEQIKRANELEKKRCNSMASCRTSTAHNCMQLKTGWRTTVRMLSP